MRKKWRKRDVDRRNVKKYRFLASRRNTTKRKKLKRRSLRAAAKKKRRQARKPATTPRPNTDIICHITEHKGTEAGKVLKNKGGLVVDVLHANKNLEIDSLGVDLVLFLTNGLAFPIQVKPSDKYLQGHYDKYPYIYATVVSNGRRVEDLAQEFEEVVHAHAHRFYELQSCVPNWAREPEYLRLRPSPVLSALTKKSLLVANYHEANIHPSGKPEKNELRTLGFTGLAFLRNGFALFIRRESSDLPPAQLPGITIPAGLDPEAEAELILDAVRVSTT